VFRPCVGVPPSRFQNRKDLLGLEAQNSSSGCGGVVPCALRVWSFSVVSSGGLTPTWKSPLGERKGKRIGKGRKEAEGADSPHSLHSKDEEIGGRGSSALTPEEGSSRGCGSSSLLSGEDRKTEGAVRPHSLLRREN